MTSTETNPTLHTTSDHQDDGLNHVSAASEGATHSSGLMDSIRKLGKATYLSLALGAAAPMATGTLSSCETEQVEPQLTETEQYKTGEEWLAAKGIPTEVTPIEGLGAVTMIHQPVAGTDGLYYIKMDIRLNKDVIKTLGEKVCQTSGLAKEDIMVGVNFRDASQSLTIQSFIISYSDVLNSKEELFASQLTPNPISRGKDMEKLYRPGSTFSVTLGVEVKPDLFKNLIELGIITSENQADFSNASVFFYSVVSR